MWFSGSGWRRCCVCEVQRDATEQETAEVKTDSLSLTVKYDIRSFSYSYTKLSLSVSGFSGSTDWNITGASSNRASMKHPQIWVKNRRYFIMNQQRSWQKPPHKSTLQMLCDFINAICTRYTVSEQFHLISHFHVTFASKIKRKERKLYMYKENLVYKTPNSHECNAFRHFIIPSMKMHITVIQSFSK